MFEEIKELLVNELDVDENLIKPEAQLASELGVNSLELADLVLMCEDNYGLSISDNDIKGFITVQDLVNYLEANKK